MKRRDSQRDSLPIRSTASSSRGRFHSERGTDVAVGGPAEAEAGGGHDVGLLEQAAAELGRGVALGAGDPDVEGRRGGRHIPAQLLEGPDEGVAAFLVEGADRRGERGVLVQGRLGGELDGREDARVGVGLDLPERGDHGSAADGEADAPAGHVEGLGQAVELDRHVLGTGNLEDAGDGVSKYISL